MADKKTEKKPDENERYRTNSLSLASYLETIDSVNFVGADKSDPHKIVFEFEPGDKAREEADKYFAGQVDKVVQPVEVFKNYRSMKDLVFDARRNI